MTADPPTPRAEQPLPSLSWEQTVLAKFPAFDPRWDTDAMLAWFVAFLRLVENPPARLKAAADRAIPREKP